MNPYSDQEICDRILEAFEGHVTQGECSPTVYLPQRTHLKSEIEEALSLGLSRAETLEEIMNAIERWSDGINAECDGADPETDQSNLEVLRLMPKIRRMCAGEEFVP